MSKLDNINRAAHKFSALDSLRGIAAIMVLFQHFWEMNHNADNRLRPWLFFCAGHEAVILFFVMSGFVLSHQLRQFKFKDYHQFVLKRIFRIYPAYYFSLILSASLLIYIEHYHRSGLTGYGLKPWFYIWSQTNFDKPLLFGSLTLFLHEGNSLNVAAWSLYYEIWLSLLFPILLWLICRTNYRFSIVTLVLISLTSYWFYRHGEFLDNQWQSILYYSWYFILGMLLYKFYPKLENCVNSWTLCVGLACYFSNYILYGQIANRLTHEVIIAIGSGLIILNAIHNSHVKKCLNWSLFKFYGKISYSFYLLHLPILYTLSYLLLKNHSLFLVKLLTFIIIPFAAYVSYNLIELPCIKYIQNLVNKKDKVKSQLTRK